MSIGFMSEMQIILPLHIISMIVVLIWCTSIITEVLITMVKVMTMAMLF